MDRWVDKVAIVTGASGGIGSAIVTELVKVGVLVVGLDKQFEKLKKLSLSLAGAKGKLYPVECDLSKEEDLHNAFKRVNDEFGGVDILVNNAGVAKYKRIIDDDFESLRNILEVNVLAMAVCIRAAVTSMKSRDVVGHIVNINSIFGHMMPGPGMNLSLYSPSKHAVTVLTETVRKELAVEGCTKIKITSISPGLVNTEIHKTVGVPDVDEFFRANAYLEPKDIADGVLYVLGTRDKVQVTELSIRPTGEML